MSLDPLVQFGREAEKYLTSAVHSDQAALNELVSIVSPKGGIVLDIGTGAGHVALAFAPHVERVVAVDPTQNMLDVAQAEATKRGLTNFETCCTFAESLPFENESINGVTCRLAAHHFNDVPLFLSEVHRCLAKGGWFLLVDTISPEDNEADNLVNEFESIRDPSHMRNYKQSEWCELAQSAGKEIQLMKTRSKRLNLQDWMDRMSVSPENQAILRKKIEESTGVFRAYLAPDENSFALAELTMLAMKRN